ncbi:MAG: DUF2267 domain-containing protein [Xanthobacteraceae bacterium]|nr:DUF2267 domain-containing protein [Xanthobacteraceae bacterium]
MTPNLDFAIALQATEAWVDDLAKRLAWHDRSRAWRALIATLHALRDCLGRDEAVHVGTELPALLRGFYYEGWHPHTPRMTRRELFLERIVDGVHHDVTVDAEQVARAVTALLAARMSAPELEGARAATPAAIHNLWPE